MGVSKVGVVINFVNWCFVVFEVKGIFNYLDVCILFFGDEFVGMINKIKGEFKGIEKVIVMESVVVDY